MYGIGEAISGFFTLCFVILCLAIGSSAYSFYSSVGDDDIIPSIGNSIENIEQLKRDCEKSLPRNQECVMVYEFVPVKKESESE